MVVHGRLVLLALEGFHKLLGIHMEHGWWRVPRITRVHGCHRRFVLSCFVIMALGWLKVPKVTEAHVMHGRRTVPRRRVPQVRRVGTIDDSFYLLLSYGRRRVPKGTGVHVKRGRGRVPKTTGMQLA